MTFADIGRRVGQFAINNSPTILTSVGVVGAITTAYLTGKASYEAAGIIALKEGTEGVSDDPRKQLKERVELVWKLYIPAVTTGAATVACIIGANQIGNRRYAGLAAATTIIEKTFDEYKVKVVEKLGESKEKKIRDEIAQDRINATYLDGVEIFGAEVGQLCYDKFSDRYFRSTVEDIRAAANDVNHELLHDNYAPLASFYDKLSLGCPAYTYEVGWNSDRLLELAFSTAMAPGDIPCIQIDFKTIPVPGYGRFH